MHAQIGITTAYFGRQVVDSLHHFHGYSLPLLSPLLPSGDHPLLSPLLAPPRTTTKTLGTRTSGETGGAPTTATANERRALTTPHTTAHHLPTTTSTRWEPPRTGASASTPIWVPRTCRTWPVCDRPRWAPRARNGVALGHLDEAEERKSKYVNSILFLTTFY